MDRRSIVIAGIGCVAWRPALATPETMAAAISAFGNGRAPRDGRVTLDISPLVENGNAVPVAVSVQSPMSAADHVQRIALFTSANPQTEVAVFHLSPRNGTAVVATRVRLATSQTIVALALMNDGSVWQARSDVLVTLAACIEGG